VRIRKRSTLAATSDETHRKIRALLSDHEKELEKAMVQSEHRGQKKDEE
jgi:hypothetical protein